jgi:hypothetical protein
MSPVRWPRIARRGFYARSGVAVTGLQIDRVAAKLERVVQ